MFTEKEKIREQKIADKESKRIDKELAREQKLEEKALKRGMKEIKEKYPKFYD
jgi:hypothetical protein